MLTWRVFTEPVTYYIHSYFAHTKSLKLTLISDLVRVGKRGGTSGGTLVTSSVFIRGALLADYRIHNHTQYSLQLNVYRV